ncbi:NADH dehydrogenase [ubiquinone] 1 beta subcomplex subunit 10 [Eleutherodactylus coqui]|uniref:NADH dehydrogenase [ubiquinone] 1 beta subcomplex subunit 10 n=1 Tax=Eleutherodactylus coqui TaxID=57060 RepID=UPI003462B041
MPKSVDKDVYPERPTQTPLQNQEVSRLDPVPLLGYLYSQVVDRPVTALHDLMDHVRGTKRLHYYHREFSRVPDLTACLEEDHVCQYEANQQWKRDYMVDQEIMKILRDNVASCNRREGANAEENCAPVVAQYAEACKAYKSRYAELGYYSGARRCLMKQKARMMDERKKAAQEEAKLE